MLSNVSMSFLYWGLHLWKQYSRCSLTSTGVKECQDQFPWPAGHPSFYAAYDALRLSGHVTCCWVRAHCWLMSSMPFTIPPSFFLQGCALSFHTPACIDSGGCCDPGPRAWFCWTSWGTPGPIVTDLDRLYRRHPIPQVCWLPTQLGVIYRLTESALDPTVCVTEGIKEHLY